MASANTDPADDAVILRVDTDLDVDTLTERAAGVDEVRIHVTAFTDGRFFSQVRALVESPSFRGRIAVHGDLLPDQIGLLERYGVDDITLENGLRAEDRPRFLAGAYRERRLEGVPARKKGVQP